VKKGDVEELAEKIVELLLDQNLSKKISAAAFREVKKYDWKKIVKRIEAVYKW